MKSYKVLPIILILGTFVLSACGINLVKGSGNVVSESRQVNNFDAVQLIGSGDVIITQGNEEGLKIEAEDNLIRFVRSEVRDRTLQISMDRANVTAIQTTRPMRFYVSMKNVTGLSLSGSGNISSRSIIGKNLDININGSGDTSIDSIKADSLTINISGSGNCMLKGDVANQKMIISGSGGINTSDVNSKDVVINLSGSGKAKVMATDTLKATISGSGDVFYSGNPRVSQNVTGSGKISAN